MRNSFHQIYDCGGNQHDENDNQAGTGIMGNSQAGIEAKTDQF